jgi:membrane protein
VGRIARLTAWSKLKAQRLSSWALVARGKYRTVDAGFLAADRDKRVAAGVLAGGVAYRFFFWILAMSLVTNGALGFIDTKSVQSALAAQGVSASVIDSIQDTEPSDVARWWLLVIGVWLVLWTGYLGAKALILVHSAVWGVAPPRVRRADVASLVFTGTALGFIASMAAVRWLREELPSVGLAATLAVVIIPFTIWLLASSRLPHRGVGLMDLVPGAALVAVGLQCLHLFTVYFLGPKLESATELYGVLGVVSTFLFWLYIAGRLVLGAATLNASIYEQRNPEPVPPT